MTLRFTRFDAYLLSACFIVGLITRFAMLNYPRACVFDEFHFGKFVNGYLSGEYFFDIHPPLGKLILTVVAKAGGYNGTQAWATIGEPIHPSINLFALRAGPAFQGALLPPLLYIAGRALGLSRPASLLAPAGALFDTCLLVEQRIVVTDATLMLGVGLHLAMTFASDHYKPLSREWLWRIAAAGLGITLAVCTKWTGAACLALGGAHSLLALHRTWSTARSGSGVGKSPLAAFKSICVEAVARLTLLLLIPALFYLLCDLLHLYLLPLTGPGSNFMTAAFRTSLIGETELSLTRAKQGSPNPTPLTLYGRLLELNTERFRANKNVMKGHDWSSKWFEWPLMLRSVRNVRAPPAPPLLSHPPF